MKNGRILKNKVASINPMSASQWVYLHFPFILTRSQGKRVPSFLPEREGLGEGHIPI